MVPVKSQGNIKETLPKVKNGRGVSGVCLLFLINLQHTLCYYAASRLPLRWGRGGAVQVASDNSKHTVNYRQRLGLPGVHQEAIEKKFLIDKIFSGLVTFLKPWFQVFREEQS